MDHYRRPETCLRLRNSLVVSKKRMAEAEDDYE